MNHSATILKVIVGMILAFALVCGAILIPYFCLSTSVASLADESPSPRGPAIAHPAGTNEIPRSGETGLSANELFNRGITQLKRGNRDQAYLAFKAALESGQRLDVIRAQRLKDYLQELAPDHLADSSNSNDDLRSGNSEMPAPEIPADRKGSVEAATQRPDEQDQAFDRECRDLARQLRSAAPSERAQLQQSLRRLIERHFEYRQTQRVAEIERLRQRLQALKMMTIRRNENQEGIINRRLMELTDPNAVLQWDDAIPNKQSKLTKIDLSDQNASKRVGPPLEQSIESSESISRPKPAPLADEERLGKGTVEAEIGKPIDSLEKNSIPVPEKTFDGVPYSQCLMLLDTERKPGKLAIAIEACSRLAEPQDQRRIAHAVLVVASLFETGDSAEQQQVWQASDIALNRLSPEIVVDEFIAAFQDEQLYRSGREFQGQFLGYQDSKEILAAAEKRAVVLIGAMQKVIADGGKGAEYVLVAASHIWRHSGRPLSDFGTLKSQMLNAISIAPQVDFIANQVYLQQSWKSVATDLVEGAPDTPGLLSLFMKHSDTTSEVLTFVGKLGPRAEPAVPQLVNQFVRFWKESETERRETSPARRRANARNQNESVAPMTRCVQIVKTLGEIGVGEQGYLLLKTLKLMAPSLDQPRQSAGRGVELYDSGLFEAAAQALKKFVPPAESQPATQILDDSSLIQGRWKLRAAGPARFPSGLSAIIGPSAIKWLNAEGRQVATNSLEVDDSHNPHHLTIVDRAPAIGTHPFLNGKLWMRVETNAKIQKQDHLWAEWEKKLYEVEVLDVQPDGRLQIRWISTGETSGDVAPTDLYYVFGSWPPGAVENSQNAELRMLGIFEVTDTSLKIQLAPRGAARPTEFANDKSKLPEGQILLEFERHAPE